MTQRTLQRDELASIQSLVGKHYGEMQALLEGCLSHLQERVLEPEPLGCLALGAARQSSGALWAHPREGALVTAENVTECIERVTLVQPAIPTGIQCITDDWALGRELSSELTTELDLIRAISFTQLDAKDKEKARLSGNRASSMLSSDWVEDAAKQSWVNRLVTSYAFEVVVMIAVVLNSIFLGVQIEYMAMKASENNGRTPIGFLVATGIFDLIFTLELALRMGILSFSTFFCGEDRLWNCMDVVVVSASDVFLLWEAIMPDTGAAGKGIMALRLMRLARFVRTIRLVRIIRFIRPLRILVYGILATTASLLWALALLSLMIYVVGLILTQAATDHLQHVGADERLELGYGTVRRATWSLLLSICGGEDWGNLIEPLRSLNYGGFYTLVFTIYVLIVYFAVLNVMIGIFCQNAIEGAEKDKDMVIHRMCQQKQEFVEQLKNIFEADFDKDENKLTLVAFEDHLRRDGELKAWFTAVNLDIDDGWTLFRLLDPDSTGMITFNDFVEGCFRLRGFAKAIDIQQCLHGQRSIRKKCEHIDKAVELLLRKLRLATGNTGSTSALPTPSAAAHGDLSGMRLRLASSTRTLVESQCTLPGAITSMPS